MQGLRLLQQYSHLNKACRGRHLGAREFFVAGSGNVTNDVIREYMRAQDATKDDGDFRAEGADPV